MYLYILFHALSEEATLETFNLLNLLNLYNHQKNAIRYSSVLI